MSCNATTVSYTLCLYYIRLAEVAGDWMAYVPFLVVKLWFNHTSNGEQYIYDH